MSLPRVLAISIVLLFGGIFALSLYKKSQSATGQQPIVFIEDSVIEIPISLEDSPAPQEEIPAAAPQKEEPLQHPYSEEEISKRRSAGIKNVNKIESFFRKGDNKFPIVETITYKSRVPWMKERSAWLADYASHYKTSRHFIARSLNGKPDYTKQDVSEGDRFNVINPDKNVEFYLVVDAQLCKLFFYYVDHDRNERTLVKTYDVGLGRVSDTKTSGLLTPLGKYSLGDKVAVYKPGKFGDHNRQRIEMVSVFGTRWIPFKDEIARCTEPAKGLGIHGLPWISDGNGHLIEDINSLGKYSSDGCIRLAQADIEELFSIVITRPATIEVVKNIADAHIPGTEKP